ncbi:MAG: altronate dehydratase family protein [Lachnospiraceae bacterium]|nr:altronate dehydratase family protein [Lachnospiraceae bacterium]
MEYIIINDKDNVAVALTDLTAGSRIESPNGTVVLKEDIMRGHKVTLCDLKEGDNVIKYGNPIGHVITDVAAGCHIHVQNIKTNLGDLLEYEYHPELSPEPVTVQKKNAVFQGYVRKNGKVGVRNEIWIVPTVGCVNSIATKLSEINRAKLHGNAEDIVAFPHPYGCSQMGDDQENTRTILADLINHPNAGAVLVLGLGCENSNIEVLKKYIGDVDTERVRFLQCQDVEDELAAASEIIEELIDIISEDKREGVSADKLIIGMKCGGSDGLSGITANPTVGLFSDKLIGEGGTTILTEVPEMFGAETLLMNRCESKEVFDKTVALINNFKEYFIKNNQTIYENPSPGNKKGGISTLEDKSLGCTQKSGSAKVSGVLEYGERVEKSGLNLLSAPGNDLVAATALAASGAQIVLFTTGRGTPFASPVPTVKISTNSPLAGKKDNWIDFNCGVLVDGEDKDKLADEFFEYVLKVASGEKVRHEVMGYRDMAIFKNGVTL